MDEIFGYFPPVANPPSKLPLLTLLKQGRAFGLGVVLATRIQSTSITKAYLIPVRVSRPIADRARQSTRARRMEGAAAERTAITAGDGKILAGLSSRIFVLNNTHDEDRNY